MATIKTLVTYLEMLNRRRDMLPALPANVTLKYIEKIDLKDYLTLYKQIGNEYCWTSRLLISETQLSQIIHHSNTKIFVLFDDEIPIGFFELNSKNAPKSIEISFIGLIPSAIGKGLGSLITQYAIDYAWVQNPGRIIIQTCTLDHKRALPLYQKLGFKAYNRHVAVFQTLTG